jgi:MFS family permease
MISGIGFFISSLFGGALAESWHSYRYQAGFQIVVNYHILFAISGILRFAASIYFLRLHKQGGNRLWDNVRQIIGQR